MHIECEYEFKHWVKGDLEVMAEKRYKIFTIAPRLVYFHHMTAWLVINTHLFVLPIY